MNGAFRVRTNPHFDRLARRLHKQHRSSFTDRYAEAIAILSSDPSNSSGRYDIRKLASVAQDEDGQWRLRLGQFRFRYDGGNGEVRLLYCGLRRDDTYR